MRLKDFIKKYRWTIQEFAVRAEYSRTFVSRIVNGKAKAGPRTARILSNITRGYVSVEEIMNEYHLRQQEEAAKSNPQVDQEAKKEETVSL